MAKKVTQSKKYSLNKQDLVSIGKGLLITMSGVGLTYLSEAISNFDFGSYSPIVVAMFALIVNAVRKFIAGTK